jgi:hypothetical protein
MERKGSFESVNGGTVLQGGTDGTDENEVSEERYLHEMAQAVSERMKQESQLGEEGRGEWWISGVQYYWFNRQNLGCVIVQQKPRRNCL